MPSPERATTPQYETGLYVPGHYGTGLSRVPEISAAFWLTKILTTGMGETTSDFFVTRFEPVVAVLVAAVVLAGVLVLQFRARRYLPWLYWLTVAAISVFGTMAADVAHVAIGIPYPVSTLAFAAVLAVVLTVWHRTEGTLSVHSITTGRREALYWMTVLVTFALGTAAGDLTATVFHLGYLGSGLLFAALILVPVIAFRFSLLGATAAFWFAYTLTRPLGASFADWFGVSAERGGLDLGTGPVSLVLAGAIACCVLYLAHIERARTRAT
ncbi:MAG: hypothetical protein H7146_04275 [Burkholderiaceae bacterium]|nr:hypothetical protein [Microbacteriaceae bacterium]